MNYNNIDLSGIKRFKASIKKVLTNTQEKEKNEMSLKFGSFAYRILSESYVGTGFQVSQPQFYKGGFNIYASGEGIAFDEFGTGIYAKGSYKGNLPTQTITFTTIVGRDESGNAIRGEMSTNGWEYYYPNEYTKVLVGGRLGWMTGKNYVAFQEGHSASNRFYDACQKIREGIKGDNK